MNNILLKKAHRVYSFKGRTDPLKPPKLNPCWQFLISNGGLTLHKILKNWTTKKVS